MHKAKIKEYEVNINFKHDQYSNCIQDIFITYLNWKKYSYFKLFDHTWSFSFKSNGPDGWGIDTYRNGFTQLFESLYYNFGINLKFYNDLSDEDRTLGVMSQELEEGRIVGLEIDPYYCEWHRVYRKYHSNHFVLITGISKEYLICIDPYTSDLPKRMPFKLFFQGAKKIFLIAEEISVEYDWQKNMYKNLNNIFVGSQNMSDFEQMRKFSDYIDEVRIKNEVDKYDSMVFYPLLLRLNNVGDSRRSYSSYLDYLMTIQWDINFSKYSEELIKASRLWSETGALMLKYILSDYNEVIRKKLKAKIINISETEEAIANELLCQIRP